MELKFRARLLESLNAEISEPTMPNFENLLNQMDTSGIAFFHKGFEGHYRYINECGATMLGQTVAAIIGSSDFDIFAASSAEMIRDRDKKILAAGLVCDYRSVAQTRKGWKLFHTIKIPMRSTLPGLDGLIGLSADITLETDRQIDALLISASEQIIERQGFPHELFDVLNTRRLNLPYAPNLSLSKLPAGHKVISG